MKVYAEFIKEDEKEYRKKTLLQFGNSTKLIGSVVLMNPGSAKPIKDCGQEIEIVKSFFEENHKIELTNENEWYIFKADPTMRFCEKIFNGGYIGESKKLDGVIQLFNCYYYRNEDVAKAKENFSKNSENIFEENHLLSDMPIYFGWGNVGKYGFLQDIAIDIFSKYKLDHSDISPYKTEFYENKFYHPVYINRSSKKNQMYLRDFFNFLNQIK
ncbi:MAG: hypothetical protein LBR81_06345 [Prevotellaceae bacterium]|jgi:hypothetical protein|nr:hypothetical protein [Prevotellaceae bacterium]